jgi:CopG-like RHH_1 or ribbon-helix-helix domain, RHH_5
MEGGYTVVESLPPEEEPIPEGICIKLPPHVYKRLRKLAEKEERTLASMLRRLITQAPL